MNTSLWSDVLIGSETYALMNLDHPEVTRRVISEIDAGIDVYYDRRWEATGILCQWLAEHKELFQNKRVLVLGAGVGAETVILGRHCKQIWINDLAPTALDLCAEQLNQNGILNFNKLLGSYEDIALPQVDLVVASFLIYNKATITSMRAFMGTHQGDLILVNELLNPFPAFLKEQSHSILFDQNGALGVLLSRSHPASSTH